MTKIRVTAICAVLMLGLVGCVKTFEDEALEAVANKLRDPESAIFREIKQKNEYAFCGEVNGKNAYGAYVGYKKFYVNKITGEWSVYMDSDDGALTVASIKCKKE